MQETCQKSCSASQFAKKDEPDLKVWLDELHKLAGLGKDQTLKFMGSMELLKDQMVSAHVRINNLGLIVSFGLNGLCLIVAGHGRSHIGILQGECISNNARQRGESYVQLEDGVIISATDGEVSAIFVLELKPGKTPAIAAFEVCEASDAKKLH